MIEERSEPLRLTGLGTRYGGKSWALRDVDVEVPAGSTLAVLGPSGCGKSTLLKLVAGLEKPDAGRIYVGERVLSTAEQVVSPERRDVSMVFQDYALWPHMQVAEIIGYGLRYGMNRVSRSERRERVEELIGLMQLEGLAHRRPAELSGGQQQRVAIARALATRPALLLFDEPLSNLDAQLRGDMREELALLLRRLGTTALYVTHDVGEALALADQILVLEKGRAAQLDTPQGMFSRPVSGWVASLAGFSSQVRVHGMQVQDCARGMASAASGRLLGRYCGRGSQEAVGAPGTGVAHLHPEGVRFDDAPTALRGRVLSSVFEGRHHRLRVDLGEAGTVVLTAGRSREPGETVGLSVDPESVLLFGEPLAPSADPEEPLVSSSMPGAVRVRG